MGNFLDRPIVDKETDVGFDAEKNMSFGVSAMQGWRAQMEDDHLHLTRLHENVRILTSPFSCSRVQTREEILTLLCLMRCAACLCSSSLLACFACSTTQCFLLHTLVSLSSARSRPARSFLTSRYSASTTGMEEIRWRTTRLAISATTSCERAC